MVAIGGIQLQHKQKSDVYYIDIVLSNLRIICWEAGLWKVLRGSPNKAEWKTGGEILGTFDDESHLWWFSAQLKAVYGPM